MTIEEKTYKIATASKDLKTLNSLLDVGEHLYKEGKTIQKIMITPDYKEFINTSRALHKISLGTTPFGSLKYWQQRKIVNMLIDAVGAYLSDLQTKTTENEDKNI